MLSLISKKYAFTLVELVVAITISSIILIGLFSLIGDTISELWQANNSSEMIVDINDLLDTMNDYNSIYDKKDIIIDWLSGQGTDVLMFTNSANTSWILFALIDPESKKVINNTEQYESYNRRYIWYKELSDTEISAIMSDTNVIYAYSFFPDKVNEKVSIIDFQLEFYNSWKIIEMDLDVLIKYNEKHEISWKKITEIEKREIYPITLNF